MTVTVKIVGLEELRAKLATVAPAVARTAMGAALYAEGNAILAAAIPLTPIEFGTLRSSGKVTPPEISGLGAITVTIGFGGAAKDYAVVQHEHLEFNHPIGGQAKYLEEPAVARAQGMGPRLGAAVEAALGAAL